MELLRIIVVSTIFLAATAYRLIREVDDDNNDDNLSLDQRFVAENTCIAKNGEDGLCVHESFCNEEHTIMPGGVIHKSEFRELAKPCPGQFIWCCTKALVIEPPIISNKNTESCLAPQSDVIPWAVSLYKIADVKQTAQSVFCLGSLIGTRIILTAATCLKSAQQHMLYARIPGSPEPARNYTVRHRKFHPEYNSGSHVFDFGLLVLEEEVKWGSKKGQGACLDFQKPAGDCMTLGFDSNDEITSTLLKVTSGSCSNFGGKTTSEITCGTNADDQCIATPGGPVLCESKKGNAVVVGVIRSECNKDQIQIGNIAESSKWLLNEMKAMKVPKDVFIQK
nr:kallikrein-4-like isoform X1 [Vanessa tameamea]